MDREIALVQSRTFWAALLAFIAVVAKGMGWSAALAWAVNPQTTDLVLQGVTLIGIFGAGLFRILATRQVTSTLPKAAIILALICAGGLLGQGRPAMALALFKPVAAAAAPAPAASDPLSLFVNGLASALKNGATSLVADLQAADADATAHGDAISDQCYKAEIAFAQGVPALATPAGPIGPIQLFQIKRDIQNAFSGGIPNSLKLGCGPLWLDEQSALLKFTTALGGLGLSLAK